MTTAEITSRFALDVGSLEQLKRAARENRDGATRAAASQFEALFVQMMLKSMRESVTEGGLFDSQETKLYTSMLDQQLSQALAKRGLGLADVMARQLERAGAAPDPGPERPRATPAEAPAAAPAPSVPAPLPASVAPAASQGAGAQPSGTITEAARGFISRIWSHAVEAGRATGIAPHFIAGQAALESGWGRGEIRNADGSPSHNLFGIKAGRGWNGAVAEVMTTEYVNGAPVRSVERFRAYGSYAEAFRDYANLLLGSDRYQGVLGSRDVNTFARGLQSAGYATDPAYADKLTRVITGTVMRAGLGG